MPSFLEKDRVVLIGLRDYRARYLQRRVTLEYARLLDIARGEPGGMDYASAMKRLVVLGLADRRQRTDIGNVHGIRRSRGSYEYRISAAGLAFLGDAS